MQSNTASPLPADAGHPKALVALYDRNIDMAKGFATMVEKAEPSFRETAATFLAIHNSHSDALSRLLTNLGANADQDGTFTGAVHQAVVTLRGFFDDIDEGVMGAVRNGEAALLKAYDEAITETTSDAVQSTLRDLRHEVSATLDATAHLG